MPSYARSTTLSKRCPKCDGLSDPKFQDKRSGACAMHRCALEGEHLHLRCYMCHFQWGRLCDDVEPTVAALVPTVAVPVLTSEAATMVTCRFCDGTGHKPDCRSWWRRLFAPASRLLCGACMGKGRIAREVEREILEELGKL